MAQTLIYMSEAGWNADGEQRFGPDRLNWKFVCPCCSHIASMQDYKNAGASSEAVAFSCIGRWTGAARGAFESGPGPCDYAGGGLLQLNPVQIGDRKVRYFAFAPADDLRFALQTQEL